MIISSGKVEFLPSGFSFKTLHHTSPKRRGYWQMYAGFSQPDKPNLTELTEVP